jgi:hypothetical protein
MEAKEIIEFIQTNLNQSNINELNSINRTTDQELRRNLLRSFFHRESIFNKIKPVVDPTWLSSEIFIKGAAYEF